MMRHILIPLIILIFIFSGCRTQREYIYQAKTDSLFLSSVKYDSVYIYSNIYQKADTVFIDRFEYKYKLLRDTAYRFFTDTIYRDRAVTKTEYKSSGFSIFCICFFFLFIIGLVIYIIIKINKF